MSLTQLETQIWQECQEILKNQKMRKKDLLEWSTGDVTPEEGETAIRIERLGVNTVVSESLDRRPKE